MHMLAQQFFTGEEQQRITRTIHAVEQQTTGEIVPMVVSSSHAYPEAVITGAALLALPAALLAAFATSVLLWWRGEVLWLFLLYFPLFFLAARPLMRYPALLRLCIGRQRAEEEVERAALTHFHAEGLQVTRDATGVLIYISVLERKVWILGDRGINEQLEPQVWQTFVDRLVRGIRGNRQCESLCAVIAEIGGLLHTHFPPKADDRNELSDLMIAGPDGAVQKRRLVVR